MSSILPSSSLSPARDREQEFSFDQSVRYSMGYGVLPERDRVWGSAGAEHRERVPDCPDHFFTHPLLKADTEAVTFCPMFLCPGSHKDAFCDVSVAIERPPFGNRPILIVSHSHVFPASFRMWRNECSWGRAVELKKKNAQELDKRQIDCISMREK